MQNAKKRKNKMSNSSNLGPHLPWTFRVFTCVFTCNRSGSPGESNRPSAGRPVYEKALPGRVFINGINGNYLTRRFVLCWHQLMSLQGIGITKMGFNLRDSNKDDVPIALSFFIYLCLVFFLLFGTDV